MPENQKRWWDPLSAVLLAAALTTIAYRLTDTQWTDNLNLVIGLTVVGFGLGLALGYSRFSPRLVGLFGFLFSAFFLTWQLGELTPRTYIWLERLWLIGDRILTSLLIFLRNDTLTDSILFLLNMVLLFWLVAITAGYNLTRYGKPWQSLIIAGIALVIIDLYHPPLAENGVATGVFAVLSLILVTRIFYLKRSREWEVDLIAVDSDTGFNIIKGTLVAIIVVVVLAWNAPNIVRAMTPNTPERRRMIENLQSFRQRFENITAPLRGAVTVPVEFYSDQFSLGTGSYLTDQNIFTVKPSITQRIGVAYYWRIRSYDQYSAGRWESTNTTSRRIWPTDEVIRYDNLSRRISMTFDFRPVRNLSMLYVPGLPLTIDKPAMLIYDGADGRLEDVITVTVEPMLRPGTTYTVASAVAAPTIADMRAAGSEYPEWVSERYLQLPDDLPDSISALAEDITAGLDNPYDKTAAITRWLRENIEYVPVLPEPPAGRDPIEWFLFEQKQGFCNYYATAEILMLRSLGIPARWVIGYAQGFLDEEEEIYWIRDKDRHAWPEVYFPGLGWIEFEPTALQAEIARPSGEGVNPDRSPLFRDESGLPQLLDDFEEATRFDEEGRSSSANLQTTPLVSAVAIVMGLVVVLIAAFLIIAGRARRLNDPDQSLPALLERTFRGQGWKIPRWLAQWSLYNHLSPIERSFYTIAWLNRILGVQAGQGWTPGEHIHALINALPEGAPSAALLLQEYQKAIYSPYPADTAAAQEASRHLWKQALQNRGKMVADKIGLGKSKRSSV